jgi:Class II flagellar assembly regulator
MRVHATAHHSTALDELKLGALAGAADAGMLGRLKVAATTLAQDTGDSQLDGVLAKISLRAEVELAKFARGQAQASV